MGLPGLSSDFICFEPGTFSILNEVRQRDVIAARLQAHIFVRSSLRLSDGVTSAQDYKPIETKNKGRVY